ncbi:FtsL-like putative cell division protein [Roseivirga sp. BDSF3-8]|uniref:FtsL-like putative cell division protein n=1 Tax=Roseivirga sp. BDSF3-8 TaxID=3241598 RepID=UPI0035321EEE
MAENRFKKKEKKSNGGGGGLGRGIFGSIERALKIGALFEQGVPVKFMPYGMFLAFLLVFYIWNTHYAERTTRKVNVLEVEVEDMKADYTTMKADYEVESKLSSVAKRVKDIGLIESPEPPKKLVVQ